MGLKTHFFFSPAPSPSPFSASFLIFFAGGLLGEALLEAAEAFAAAFFTELFLISSSSSLVLDSAFTLFFGVVAPLGLGRPPVAAFFLAGLTSSSESVEETAAEDLRFFEATGLLFFGLISSSSSVDSTLGARFLVADEAAEVEAFGFDLTLGLRSTSSSSELEMVTMSTLPMMSWRWEEWRGVEGEAGVSESATDQLSSAGGCREGLVLYG